MSFWCIFRPIFRLTTSIICISNLIFRHAAIYSGDYKWFETESEGESETESPTGSPSHTASVQSDDGDEDRAGTSGSGAKGMTTVTRDVTLRMPM